ncbi:MAG TPA: glycine cleavage system protein GcvH [Gammaproteobacteria bacterium]|nr:glycine cleavage system protein GcvH [Gammaproteobacteria bacterium]
MSDIPADLKYTKSHEWVRQLDDDDVLVGITDHAQELLGDMVYVELPAEGDMPSAGEECVVVESVKAASDIYCPVTAEIISVNEALVDQPELINKDPYGEGWILRLKASTPDELDGLLSADDYAQFIASETE